MTKNLLAAAALSLTLLSSCTTNVLAQPSECASFLHQMLKAGVSDSKFDLEARYGMEVGTSIRTYDSIHSLSSFCAPGNIDATPPGDIKSPWNAPNYIDVATGVHGGAPWIQFVYPTVDEEYGPGLSSSIVFYDDHGNPTSTVLVSSYHSWEEAKVSRSRITGSGLEICTQTINPYSYTESGEIDDELDEPVRSPCEISHASLPNDSDASLTPGK